MYILAALCNLLIGKSHQSVPGVNAVEKASALKRDLLEAVERLGDRLPPNTLDQLIDELGGPDCVAEVGSVFLLSLHFRAFVGLVWLSVHGEALPDPLEPNGKTLLLSCFSAQKFPQLSMR